MKLVLMMYPVKQYIDGLLSDENDFLKRDYELSLKKTYSRSNSIFLDSWERCWTRWLRLKNGEFRKRFKIINMLLNEYRNTGYKIGWAFFSRNEDKNEPDLNQASDIFDIPDTDLKIPFGVTYDELNSYKYPNERKLLTGVKDLSDLVVGGFHKDDCVERVKLAAQKLGIRSSIDSLLTEEFFFTILQTFHYDLDAQMIREGFLDPVMHEDNPEEIKILVAGERISKYL